ncbi:hypothetical protein [Streptomyces luteocolor]|uniref:hypothetical protein n=1 Tax=Streptomyces luteocolor TaxID=285500 RepID=UPI000853CEED|nr:hypothetical protein [Streptomyces luteocolor]
MNGSYSGEEFRQALANGTVGTPLTLVGMVKAGEEEGALQFAPGTVCKNWVSVPVALVDRVEVLREVPCDDHTHHLVGLQLKDPGTPEGAVLLGLLRAVVKQRAQQQVPPAHAKAPAPPAPPLAPAPPVRAARGNPTWPCQEGDSYCDPDSEHCWGCCGGIWKPFASGGCLYGMRFHCDTTGNSYNAYGCWPVG